MNRYDFLIYESRQGEASIEAESPKEARDKLMELYKAGSIEFTFVTGTDNEILNITPLKAVPLQRFEIFGKEALFTDLPTDKVEWIEKIKASGATVAFVGDGINDAPVLARADVGIAMGALGSDAAIEAADVVLMDDDPSKVATAIRISRRTIRIARQNVVFAIGVKVAVLLLAALGVATMWMAVFADVGVTVIAVVNATRTLKNKD